MKKLILSIFAMLFVAVGVSAGPTTDSSDAPYVSTYGSTMKGNSALVLGNYPGAVAGTAMPLRALVNITKNDALVLVAGRGVSKTTTVGDVNFIGFAAATTAYGAVCTVLTSGVATARIGTTVVAGERLVMSANAGFLTPTSAVTAANYTSVSGTPIVGRALVSKTYSSSSPVVLVVFGNKN